MSLFDTVRKYANGIKVLTEWLGSGGEVVDQHTAQNRANTCLVCKLNVIGMPITEDAADAIKEQLEIKNHLKLHTVGERALHQCKVCGCVNRLKVWIPIDKVRPQPEDKFPDNCWIVKESK